MKVKLYVVDERGARECVEECLDTRWWVGVRPVLGSDELFEVAVNANSLVLDNLGYKSAPGNEEEWGVPGLP